MARRRENTPEGRASAKADALEVWKYLYEHPEVSGKEDLPDELRDRIRKDHSECPLCSIYFCDSSDIDPCKGCPLQEETRDSDLTYCPLYRRYVLAIYECAFARIHGCVDLSEYAEAVVKAAKAIYDRILEWDTSVEE